MPKTSANMTATLKTQVFIYRTRYGEYFITLSKLYDKHTGESWRVTYRPAMSHTSNVLMKDRQSKPSRAIIESRCSDIIGYGTLI